MRIIYENKFKFKNNIQITAQYNLQNSRVSHQETKIKTGMETYTIPNIVNGRPSSEDVSESINLMSSLQKKEKLNTLKEAVSQIHRRRKILIIGDSHVRGLSEKVSHDLNDAFNVIGITKPNADIEGITSSLTNSHSHTTKAPYALALE
jgi:hypothetical protein